MSTENHAPILNSSDSKQIAELFTQLETLEHEVEESRREYDKYTHTIDETHRKLDDVCKKHKKYVTRLEAIKQEIAENEGISQSSLLTGQNGKPSFMRRLTTIQEHINFLSKYNIRVGSLFLRFCVGRVSMRVWSQKERDLLKSEYHKFKFRTNFIYVAWPLLQMVWVTYMGEFSWVIHQWHNGWLLYLYTTLAIREYVLKLNGSSINTWWILHHHISSMGAFLSILLIRTAYNRYRFLFVVNSYMAIVIGFMQFWQTSFQRRRDYARRALGHQGRIDVHGETIDWKMPSGVESAALIFCFYTIYGMEMVLGLYCLWLGWTPIFDLFSFEVFLLGLLWIAAGLGNCVTVSGVVLQWTRNSAEKKRR